MRPTLRFPYYQSNPFSPSESAMNKTLLLLALLAATSANAQTVPRLDADSIKAAIDAKKGEKTAPETKTADIAEAPPAPEAQTADVSEPPPAAPSDNAADDPLPASAIITEAASPAAPARQTETSNLTAEDNGADSAPGSFAQRFNLPGKGKNGDYLAYCGGDVRNVAFIAPPYDSVRCQIDVPVQGKLAQERPADCQQAWVATLVLPAQGNAEIRWECRGDTDMDGTPTDLAEGQTISGEGWQCRRKAGNILCQNGEQHGFVVGKSSPKIF